MAFPETSISDPSPRFWSRKSREDVLLDYPMNPVGIRVTSHSQLGLEAFGFGRRQRVEGTVAAGDSFINAT